jgi:uncharacterized protein (TIGR02145 family)
MKAPFKTHGLKAILALFILSVLAVSCSKSGTTPDPPVVYTKPAVAIKPAVNITMTTATIVAKVVPNESGTTVSFQYKEMGTDWGGVIALPQTFAGKDSVTVTSDLISLKSMTNYYFRVIASNKGGDATSAETKFSTAAVVDKDGNYYGAVTIGTQVWMTSDLKTTHYRDGSVIPNVTDNTAWANLTTGAMCYYNNDSKNLSPLYNWYAASGTDKKSLAPEGWHVATQTDWDTLKKFLGGRAVAGGHLKSLTGWKAPNTGADNSSGFSAIMTGARDGITGEYLNGNDHAIWISVDMAFPGSVAYASYDDATLETNFVYNAKVGAAVRCIKD